MNFAPLGRAESRTLGMGSVPIVVIPHPLAGNKPDLVQEKAAAVVDEILANSDPAGRKIGRRVPWPVSKTC